MVFLHISCQDEAEARGLAGELLGRRAVGRVHLFPATALRLGDGGITEASEIVMIAETADQKVQEVEDAVRGVHTLPRVCTISISRLNREHKEWLSRRLA